MTIRMFTCSLFVLGVVAGRTAVAAPTSLTFEAVQDLGPNFGPPSWPTLTVGKDGNVYGTTWGTIFRVDAMGSFSTVHTFASSDSQPSRLVVGQDGLLYGFTAKTPYSYEYPSWPNYHGVFFRLDYQQTYTELLTLPQSIATDLVVGSDGAFYAGSAFQAYGETWWNNTGLVKLTSDGTFTALGGNDGLYSPVPILVGSDGALYGTRVNSAVSSPYGGVFRLDVAGTFSVIHQFTIGHDFFDELVLGSDGLIYAANNIGGAGSNGKIERLDNFGNINVLHEFSVADGSQPAGLNLGADGAVYGVTKFGGAGKSGTIFKVDTAGTFTTIHAFGINENSFYPQHRLLLAKDGALYGVVSGLPHSIFRVDSAGTATYPIIPNDFEPFSALVQGKDCALYGIARFPFDDHLELYRVFETGGLCQTIEFPPLADRTLGGPFTVAATASSGLPVSLQASGSCSVEGDQVSLTGGGLCTLTASQDGDARFQPASEVSQAFHVLEAPDADSDGVVDAEDNCVDVANSPQLDSNQDGYGNACDADFNDDGIVGVPDWLMLARAWGATVESPAYAPGLDTDGDGTIGGPELLLLGVSFGRGPGPSALGCAGTSPCPAP